MIRAVDGHCATVKVFGEDHTICYINFYISIKALSDLTKLIRLARKWIVTQLPATCHGSDIPPATMHSFISLFLSLLFTQTLTAKHTKWAISVCRTGEHACRLKTTVHCLLLWHSCLHFWFCFLNLWDSFVEQKRLYLLHHTYLQTKTA